MRASSLQKTIPFILTLATVAMDQLTKYLVVTYIPLGGTAVAFWGGFLRIVHDRNLGVAFSMGNNLSGRLRVAFFTVFPVIVFGLFLFYYFKVENLTTLQRYAFAGILGGGVGNIIDRVFRPEGVVDFISVKFYGLFGMAYFPTFNVADSMIVICSIIFALSLLGKGNRAVGE